MLRFKEFLYERVLSIGFNPKHDSHRERYRSKIYDVLKNSYAKIGGYGGHPSGSKEERETIHNDISNLNMKVIRRGDKITAVTLYKDHHGRKMVGAGAEQSDQGKKDYRQIASDDVKRKRSWGEVSGAIEAINRKLGAPVVASRHAEKLLGKKVSIVDREKYSRDIGGHPHTKTIVGYPKAKLD